MKGPTRHQQAYDRARREVAELEAEAAREAAPSPDAPCTCGDCVACEFMQARFVRRRRAA